MAETRKAEKTVLTQAFPRSRESRSRSEQFGADLQQGADLEYEEGYEVGQDQQRGGFDERHPR